MCSSAALNIHTLVYRYDDL